MGEPLALRGVRDLPHNLEAEQAVLGGLMLDNGKGNNDDVLRDLGYYWDCDAMADRDCHKAVQRGATLMFPVLLAETDEENVLNHLEYQLYLVEHDRLEELIGNAGDIDCGRTIPCVAEEVTALCKTHGVKIDVAVLGLALGSEIDMSNSVSANWFRLYGADTPDSLCIMRAFTDTWDSVAWANGNEDEERDSDREQFAKGWVDVFYKPGDPRDIQEHVRAILDAYKKPWLCGTDSIHIDLKEFTIKFGINEPEKFK